jgi:hypothetical protein
MITAKDIEALLATRHSKDLCVPQCKNGPSYAVRGHRTQIIDFWAMKRSWANFSTFGYEIKVSRQDFLGDGKWQGYLPYCHEFSFVCPPRLIQPEELPQDVGLIWTSKNGKVLLTKRKAVRRDVVIPESLWVYVLMCRTAITREHDPGSDADYWRRWLKDRTIDGQLGGRVSAALRQRIDEEVIAMSKANRRLSLENEALSDVKLVLDGLGVSTMGDMWSLKNNAKQAVRDATQNAELTKALALARRAIESAERALSDAKGRNSDEEVDDE